MGEHGIHVLLKVVLKGWIYHQNVSVDIEVGYNRLVGEIDLFSQVSAIYVDSQLVGFATGGNLGNDFPAPPFSVPILQIENSAGITPFKFLYELDDGYAFEVPRPNYDTSSRKRKLDTDSNTFKIFFDPSKPPFFTGVFTYVEPSIKSFSPNSYYPNANARILRIEGEHFIVNQYDTPPVVELVRDATVITLKVNIVKATEIQAVIPDIDPMETGDYLLRVRTYTKLEMIAPNPFSYVAPVVTSIRPDHGVAGLSHNIVIEGTDFHDIYGASLSTITVGGQPCSNVQVDKLTGALSCDTTIFDLGAGLVEFQDVIISIDKQPAFCDKKFGLYHPEIFGSLPDIGINVGGTDITVTGKHLMDVVTVDIGGSVCTVDPTTLQASSFVCKTAAFDMSNPLGSSYQIKANIGGGIYTSLSFFNYYEPKIDNINPDKVLNQGVWLIEVKGSGFHRETNVFVDGIQYLTTPLSTSATLYINFDSSKHPVGDRTLVVKSNGGDSNPVLLETIVPSITAISKDNGFLHSSSLVTLTCTNFPIGLSVLVLRKEIQVFVDNKQCQRLLQINANQFTCFVPAGDSVGAKEITFAIRKMDYKSTLTFTYSEPAITDMSQTTNPPKGGGDLIIDGTNLQTVTAIKFDEKEMDLTGCTIQPDQITCTIPPYTPGLYYVILYVKDHEGIEHEFSTLHEIEFIGPSINEIVPKQGSEKRGYTLTLTGNGFGINAGLIAVDVGTQACVNIAIVNDDTKITCDIPAIIKGVYNVEIHVQPDATTAAVDSMETITFTSNALSCLGVPEPDSGEGTNSPVDWWFIYKLGLSKSSSYLYMDSNSQSLVKLDDLQDPTGARGQVNFSPIEATFKQYEDYYYLFINDQPDTRTNAGGRGNSKFTNTVGNGHVKGFVIFEDEDPTGKVNGIHVQHSNPAFPSYQADGFSYNHPAQLIKFLGKPDKSQHFFCYSFNHLEDIAKYLIRNDAHLLSNRKVFPGMDTYDQNQQNRYPYFYDFIAYYEGFPARVPLAASPVQKTQKDLIADCDAIVANTLNLENTCWWKSAATVIGGGLNAVYFMKSGTGFDDKNSPYPDIALPRPATLSPYIQKKAKIYDGIDIWMPIADHFKRRMFVEMWYGMSLVQYSPTEQVLNIAHLEFNRGLATPAVGGGGGYVNNIYFGSKTDHSKIGFPMYPAYGANAYSANENYFCTGDTNRHNGQGGRGGGAVCFQNPYLVYQFNRFVRAYNSIKADGTFSKRADSIELFLTVDQPIKLDRPVWQNDILVEVKDFIATNHISKLPKQIETVTAATMPNAHDLNLDLKALRTSHANVATAGEQSVLPTPPDLPGIDILNYVSDDTMSLHYIAFDDKIGAVCEYDDALTECTKDKSRVTQIQRVLPAGYVAPDFPPVYQHPYANVEAVRNYDLEANDDFKLMKFTSTFQTKLPNAKSKIYQYMVDTSGVILTPRFETPFILRISDALCEEEVAYFMTLKYIYNQAGAPDKAKLIYSIDEHPNWANGIILAISKKLYNNLFFTKDENFDICMDTTFNVFGNIETYISTDNGDMVNPTVDQSIRRTAAAVWDWMGGSIANGAAGRVDKVDDSDSIPVTDLLNILITTSKEDGIKSLADFADYVDAAYNTDNNFQTILINNYIINPPAPLADVDVVMTMMKTDSILIHRNMKLSTTDIPTIQQSPLQPDERIIKTGIHQLLQSYMKTMNESSLAALTVYQLEKLENSIDKWITISNQSQAIQTLILDPISQYHNQPIKFIDETNRDRYGDQIDLAYEKVGTTGTRITLLSPLSIASITGVLESIIISKSTSSVKFGDLEVFYLQKPSSYNGVISSDYDGIVIATVNSKLCDIKMISYNDFTSNNFDSLCSGVGPIITSVDKLSGSTAGGYPITLNGIRFNSSMTISIGDNNQCQSSLLLSSNQMVCQVPSGVGSKNLIYLSTDQSIFNIQRTNFLFSYDIPIITDIQPDIINSFGNDLLTVVGSNFGEDETKVQVWIDEVVECSPITLVTSSSITCLTPPAIGDYKTIRVVVDNQSSKFSINSVVPQSFSFSGPSVIGFSPSSGDPGDTIVILGSGFGNGLEQLPNVYVGDFQVDISNVTDQSINFVLDSNTLNQPIIVQAGDQSLESQFSYLPPIVTQFNNTLVETRGGLIQIKGFGWGLSSTDLKFTLNSKPIDCTAFNYFIECYIPPGIGYNLSIAASLSNQSVSMGNNNSVSYLPPSITNYYLNSGFISIVGNNFVPVESGVSFNPNSSYINLIYSNHNETCTSFISSTEVSCQYVNLPNYVQIMVGGQQSNIFTL
ncbi:hypothetical protein PPL_02577 [Heterostelium album PN500]|uniref:IPT/TIG domain-containing protein n=1 Tax=Heterostelium pallidum (strain ATCC 26659 / Pp 5 / PN500) TaxID=670386 RepID=D3B2G5_HETP5|nr:hypothetical protein PPL_02577 [Heterostelium album PN500]EFA83513.1 hypothetical protein PPL_02577 [Heterostelium album PN500]|eukprot:XP_020435630.1 hypothetical protein PPL_02577 [Heterostelium album PN500]